MTHVTAPSIADSVHRIGVLVGVAVAGAVICLDRAASFGYVSLAPSTRVVLAAAGVIAAVILVWRANRVPARPSAWFASVGLLATATLLGLLASYGAIGSQIGSVVAMSPPGNYLVSSLERWRGARAAARDFSAGQARLLGYSTTELWLVGADTEDRQCRVVWLANPTGEQARSLSESGARVARRPSCLPEADGVVACLQRSGELKLFGAEIAVAGCILSPDGAAYNRAMTDLLLDQAMEGVACGYDPDWSTNWNSGEHVGSFTVF